MIKKLDKKYLWMIIAFVSAVVLIGGVYLYSSSNIQPDHQKEFNQTSKTSSSSKEKVIDLSGEYVSSARDKAKIQKDGKSWKIDYETEDGPVSATFSTDFKVESANKVSTSQLFTDALVEETDAAQPKVVRSKQIDLKPMDLEEAILQMDLLGHDFFIYVDVEDQTTNVIYRREDGEIGLLEVKES